MATTIEALLPEGPVAPALAETVFAVFRAVDTRMSEWKPTSPLSAVNAAAGGGPVPVPADLRQILSRGMEMGSLTGGAFDISWAALWGLWDFRAASPHVPDPALVARAAALVAYRKIRIDDAAGTVFLPEAGMKLGLGGIAKGYALNRAAEALWRLEVSSFLLSAGGQVYAGGMKNGRPWSVGIRDPRGTPDDYFATLAVTDASVSTSGDYESFFISEGVRYHHILDPRTGMPSRGLRSATVICPDATLADCLSTAIMVMGAERGIALADSLPEVEAVVVDSAGDFHFTAGLKERLRVLHPPCR
jgi:thiamine biosynthesis lipoprotein